MIDDDARERDVERPAHKYAKERGWFAEKIEKTTRKGFPDHFFARNGKIILIEFKRPSKPDARMQQEKRHRELRAAGVTVYVVSDLDHAKRILR